MFWFALSKTNTALLLENTCPINFVLLFGRAFSQNSTICPLNLHICSTFWCMCTEPRLTHVCLFFACSCEYVWWDTLKNELKRGSLQLSLHPKGWCFVLARSGREKGSGGGKKGIGIPHKKGKKSEWDVRPESGCIVCSVQTSSVSSVGVSRPPLLWSNFR